MLAIELLYIAFIAFCALNQVYAIRKMIEQGATPRESRHFHNSGAALRLIAATLGAWAYNGNTAGSIAFFMLLNLIAWLLFDLIINLKAMDREPFYVGETAVLDKLLRKLGPHAGAIKAGVLFWLIYVLNLALLKGWIG